MTLTNSEVAAIQDWRAVGYSDRTIASVITLCRLFDLDIRKFALTQSTILMEVASLATNPGRSS